MYITWQTKGDKNVTACLHLYGGLRGKICPNKIFKPQLLKISIEHSNVSNTFTIFNYLTYYLLLRVR